MIRDAARTAFLAVFSLALAGCGDETRRETAVENPALPSQQDESVSNVPPSERRLATFGAGCFWCVEAVFQRLHGVLSVESGYAGGHVESPTYKQVCSGTTGHAEVAQIAYDPSKVTYDELLEVFWQTHDPTTLNRQGADVGTQYRSAVFYHDDEQKRLAETYRQKLTDEKVFDAPIVTEIVPYEAGNYYIAENYHQNYFNDNPSQGYCRAVIAPKLEKFEKVFKEKLKEP